MQLPCAWSITQGSSDIVIGVSDTRVNDNHPDLAGKILSSNGTSSSGDHATGVCGAAAGIVNNNLCVAGAGFNSVLRTDYAFQSGGVLGSMMRLAQQGVQVLTISVQDNRCEWEFDPPTRVLIRSVFQEIVNMGTTVIFAVNTANARALGNLDGAIMVGQSDVNGNFVLYLTGNNTQNDSCPLDEDVDVDENIEILAPSLNLYRLRNTSCENRFGGSSQAAPYVAGTVALMLSVNPCLTPAEIEAIITAPENTNPVPNGNDPRWASDLAGVGNLNAYQAVLAAQNFAGHPTLIVAAGETRTFQNTTLRYNDIKVETGGVLELNNCSVYIEGNNSGPYQNGRIVVERGAKLIARGSLFTTSSTNNLCAESDWSGIRVHGNIDLPQPDLYDSNGDLQVNTPLQPNEAGVVILLEGTIMEKAYNAVATAAPGYPYQEQVNRWGGLVIADNVTFRNNFRAAEFLQYPRRSAGNTFTNQSTFNNCDFITEDPAADRSLGITLWDTDGVKVTQSLFQNLGRESILTIDGSFVVENGNKFSNDIERPNHRHLSTLKTYPYDETSRIGSDDASLLPNIFLTKDADDVFIHCADIDPADPLIIMNNEFAYEGILGNSSDAPAGIELVGPQRFLISDNIFDDCERPVVLDDTGAESFNGGNAVSCNTFNNSNGPLRLDDNNEGTQLRQNTFSGTPVFGQISTNIRWDGPTDFRQGNGLNPVNNVFNTTGTQRDITVFPSTPFFQYWYTDDGTGAPTPLEPRGIEIGYSKHPTSITPSNICGQGIPPGIQGPNTPNEIAKVHNQFSEIEQYLVSNPSDTLKLIQRQEIKLELDLRVNQYVHQNVSRGEIDAAVSVLNTLQTAAAEMRSYGIYVGVGRYADAAAKLPIIGAYGQEYDEFVYVQNVNLDRMTDTLAYVLSPKVKTDLTKYAQGSSRFRSYSRALLLLLEDERFYDDWKSSSLVQKANTTFSPVENFEENTQIEEIKIFPNPSTGSIQVSGTQLTEVTSIDVLSPTGRLLNTISVETREQLSIELERIPGVYFIVFRGPHKTVSRKFIID
jgi:hypothetical protein